MDNNTIIENFVSTLCNMIETLSYSLTLQYFEENQQVWILNKETSHKIYMGNIYQIMDRAKQQYEKTMGEI